MKNKRVTIPLGEDENVSGVLSVPDDFKKGEGSGVIIAHGAGKDMTHPMLYFAGTRDSLCDLGLLKNVLERLKTPWDLEVIDGGDHSFKLPKSYGTSEQEVSSLILDKTIKWLKR